MSDVSVNKIVLFKKYVVNSGAVSFEKAEEKVTTTTNLYLGNRIYVDDIGSYSIGCRAYAYKNGKKIYGFLTAGHDTKLNAKVYYVISNEIDVKSPLGKVVGRKFGGSIDCSFVQVTNSKYHMTNKIKNANGKSLSKYVACTPTEGEIVYKSGYNGGTTKGKVLATNVTARVGNITLKHFCEASYKTKHGDSGGVVYHHGDYEFVGLQSLGSDMGEDNYFNKSSYCDQDYIFNENWGGLTGIMWY